MQAERGIKQERDEEQEGTQAKVGMSMGIMEHTHSSTAMHCERQAPDGRQVLPLAPQTHRSIKETMACGPVSLTSKRWYRNPIILPFVRGRAQRVQSVLVNFNKVPGNRDQHRRLLHQLRRLFPNRRCPCFEPWHKKKKGAMDKTQSYMQYLELQFELLDLSQLLKEASEPGCGCSGAQAGWGLDWLCAGIGRGRDGVKHFQLPALSNEAATFGG